MQVIGSAGSGRRSGLMLLLCLWVALGLVLAGVAWAEDEVRAVPEPHLVLGLPPGDHLNVRAEPDGSSEDLGDLGEGDGPFDVLERDPSGNWARIHFGERDAWIAARYLSPATREMLPDTAIPIGLRCGGTEPFWDAKVIAEDHLALNVLGAISEGRFTVQQGVTTANYPAFPAVLKAEGEGLSAFLLVRPNRCSDGMSDLTYGWEGDLMLNIPDRLVLMSGCCRTMPE